jgi:hypothetical protein
MRWYARAFLAEQGGRPVSNRLFCAHDRNAHYPEFPAASLISCANAEYRDFKRIRIFRSETRVLERSLLEVLSAADLPEVGRVERLKGIAGIQVILRISRTGYRFWFDRLTNHHRYDGNNQPILNRN